MPPARLLELELELAPGLVLAPGLALALVPGLAQERVREQVGVVAPPQQPPVPASRQPSACCSESPESLRLRTARLKDRST